MINSIGLPNKGLEGFLAEDLPQLAELPVPLIVSVMATGREEFAQLVEAVGAREEVAAIELNVSCPNVHSGLIVGEQPSETEALLERAAPADREAADRQADPQRRRPRGGRGRRRGGRRRRGLADQHPEGDGDRPGAPAGRRWRPATAASPARRCGRSPCSSCARSRRRRRCRRSAWAASARRRRGRIPRRRGSSGGGRDGELPRPEGRFAGRRGARRGGPAGGRGRASTRPRVEVEVNLGGIGSPRLHASNPRLYSPRRCLPPQSRPPPPLPSDPSIRGWRRSNGPTTFAPPGPS